MPVTVYVLRSDTTGRLYVGQTSNLPRRLAEHGAGHSPSTRGRGPWSVVAARTCETRADAVRIERSLKALKNPRSVLDAVASW